VVTRLEDLDNIGVIVSTIPPEGATVIPDALLAKKPIMLDASYMPGGAPLTKRATAAGCDLIVGPHMLFEQATYQVSPCASSPLLLSCLPTCRRSRCVSLVFAARGASFRRAIEQPIASQPSVSSPQCV